MTTGSLSRGFEPPRRLGTHSQRQEPSEAVFGRSGRSNRSRSRGCSRKSSNNFQYETVALARECESFVKDSDWSRSTFSTLYRRVKEHVAGQYGRGQGLYKYQNQTLIEQLEITPDEERHMKTLISTTEKYRRRNEKDREARGFEARRVDRAKKIVELHRAGLSLRQIAGVVGCGLATVSRELRQPLAIAIDSLTYR